MSWKMKKFSQKNEFPCEKKKKKKKEKKSKHEKERH